MYLSLLDLMRQTAGFSPARWTAPRMDIERQGGSLYCRAWLPGIDPRSVRVQVREQSLALSGYGSREERTQGPNFVRAQSSLQSFYREVPLPARVDPNRAVVQWQGEDLLVIICPIRRG